MAFSAHSGAPTPPLGAHLVLEGETLGLLAKRYRVPLPALAEANGILDVNRIRAGRTLVIPGAAPTIREQRIILALSHAEALYRAALFAAAKRSMGDPGFDRSENDALRARIEMLRGKIDAAFGHREQARKHFETARALDPDFRLRRATSPKVAELFRGGPRPAPSP